MPGGYNPANYATVAERLHEANAAIELVMTEAPAMITETMGYIRATIKLHDGRTASGIASFRLDAPGRGAQATNPIEDCETSAVGRALAFLGYQSSKSVASREEVQEAQRRAEYQPEQRQPRGPQQAAAQQRGQPMTATDAQQRFNARYGPIIGGTSVQHIRDYLGQPTYKLPRSIEEWKQAALDVKAKQDELAGLPSREEEFAAIEG